MDNDQFNPLEYEHPYGPGPRFVTMQSTAFVVVPEAEVRLGPVATTVYSNPMVMTPDFRTVGEAGEVESLTYCRRCRHRLVSGNDPSAATNLNLECLQKGRLDVSPGPYDEYNRIAVVVAIAVGDVAPPSTGLQGLRDTYAVLCDHILCIQCAAQQLKHLPAWGYKANATACDVRGCNMSPLDGMCSTAVQDGDATRCVRAGLFYAVPEPHIEAKMVPEGAPLDTRPPLVLKTPHDTHARDAERDRACYLGMRDAAQDKGFRTVSCALKQAAQGEKTKLSHIQELVDVAANQAANRAVRIATRGRGQGRGRGRGRGQGGQPGGHHQGRGGRGGRGQAAREVTFTPTRLADFGDPSVAANDATVEQPRRGRRAGKKRKKSTDADSESNAESTPAPQHTHVEIPWGKPAAPKAASAANAPSSSESGEIRPSSSKDEASGPGAS